jgi:hypothetical protein
MSHRIFCEAIIDAVDRLKVRFNDSVIENLQNPLASTITPEWHYSDSIRILSDINLNWDSLERSDLVISTATDLPKINAGDTWREEFERTFCSWYQPYHYIPREKWGIHIRHDSCKRVAANFRQSCPSLKGDNIGSVKAAILYLIIHHIFHHISENAASLMEIIRDKIDVYRKYFSNVYVKSLNSSKCLEEALANRFLIFWADECHIDREYLRRELLMQGDGYRHFINYMDSSFSEGKKRLTSQMKYGDLNPSYDEPLDILLDTSDLASYTRGHNIPIWLHHRPKPLH